MTCAASALDGGGVGTGVGVAQVGAVASHGGWGVGTGVGVGQVGAVASHGGWGIGTGSGPSVQAVAAAAASVMNDAAMPMRIERRFIFAHPLAVGLLRTDRSR